MSNMKLSYRVVTVHGDQFLCQEEPDIVKAGFVTLNGYHYTEGHGWWGNGELKKISLPPAAVRYIEKGDFEAYKNPPNLPSLPCK